MLSWFIRPITMFKILMMMGAISRSTIAATAGECPKVQIRTEAAQCTEGEVGCLDDDPRAAIFLMTLKQGCEDGKGGEGNTCLYAVAIYPNGHAKALCGPKMSEARR